MTTFFGGLLHDTLAHRGIPQNAYSQQKNIKKYLGFPQNLWPFDKQWFWPRNSAKISGYNPKIYYNMFAIKEKIISENLKMCWFFANLVKKCQRVWYLLQIFEIFFCFIFTQTKKKSIWCIQFMMAMDFLRTTNQNLRISWRSNHRSVNFQILSRIW